MKIYEEDNAGLPKTDKTTKREGTAEEVEKFYWERNDTESRRNLPHSTIPSTKNYG